jgi:tetratricopeptide (TPR) repeat protein
MKVNRAGAAAEIDSRNTSLVCAAHARRGALALFTFKGSLFSVALSFFASSSAFAAVELPRPSPAASVFEKLGTAKLTVTYSRPAVKGREIWGGLVPYGQVWRLGANDATTLEISEDAKVAGQDLKAGAYALFAIPARDKWSIVVNSQAKQWGAYFRDPKKDVFSFDVTPSAGPHQEWLEVRMHPESARVVRVELAWEKLRISFPVEVDVNGIVWKNLDAARAAAGPKDYVDFYQSARFSRETGERRAEAMGWLDEAMKRGDSFWMDELKGDLLADAGRYAEAAPHLERAIERSKKAGAPEEWRDGARRKLAEWDVKGKAKKG